MGWLVALGKMKRGALAPMLQPPHGKGRDQRLRWDQRLFLSLPVGGTGWVGRVGGVFWGAESGASRTQTVYPTSSHPRLRHRCRSKHCWVGKRSVFVWWVVPKNQRNGGQHIARARYASGGRIGLVGGVHEHWTEERCGAVQCIVCVDRHPPTTTGAAHTQNHCTQHREERKPARH